MMCFSRERLARTLSDGRNNRYEDEEVRDTEVGVRNSRVACGKNIGLI